MSDFIKVRCGNINRTYVFVPAGMINMEGCICLPIFSADKEGYYFAGSPEALSYWITRYKHGRDAATIIRDL